jgi:hypothetical protein
LENKFIPPMTKPEFSKYAKATMTEKVKNQIESGNREEIQAAVNRILSSMGTSRKPVRRYVPWDDGMTSDDRQKTINKIMISQDWTNPAYTLSRMTGKNVSSEEAQWVLQSNDLDEIERQKSRWRGILDLSLSLSLSLSPSLSIPFRVCNRGCP